MFNKASLMSTTAKYFQFTSATVIVREHQTDRCYLRTSLPDPLNAPGDKCLLELSFDAPHGQGVAYIKERFGLDVNVIDSRVSKNMKLTI